MICRRENIFWSKFINNFRSACGRRPWLSHSHWLALRAKRIFSPLLSCERLCRAKTNVASFRYNKTKVQPARKIKKIRSRVVSNSVTATVRWSRMTIQLTGRKWRYIEMMAPISTRSTMNICDSAPGKKHEQYMHLDLKKIIFVTTSHFDIL